MSAFTQFQVENPASRINLRDPGIQGVINELNTRTLLIHGAEATISLSRYLRALHGRDIPDDQRAGLRNALIDLRYECDVLLSQLQSGGPR